MRVRSACGHVDACNTERNLSSRSRRMMWIPIFHMLFPTIAGTRPPSTNNSLCWTLPSEVCSTWMPSARRSPSRISSFLRSDTHIHVCINEFALNNVITRLRVLARSFFRRFFPIVSPSICIRLPRSVGKCSYVTPSFKRNALKFDWISWRNEVQLAQVMWKYSQRNSAFFPGIQLYRRICICSVLVLSRTLLP